MYRESWYYPAGVTGRDFEKTVVWTCECCGADILEKDRYFEIGEQKYCSSCVNILPCGAHGKCEICGDDLLTEGVHYEANGELFCKRCCTEETAGEEW